VNVALETAETVDEYIIASFLLLAKGSGKPMPIDEPIWDAFFREAHNE